MGMPDMCFNFNHICINLGLQSLHICIMEMCALFVCVFVYNLCLCFCEPVCVCDRTGNRLGTY